MPNVIRGDTKLPLMMVAVKASHVIKADDMAGAANIGRNGEGSAGALRRRRKSLNKEIG